MPSGSIIEFNTAFLIRSGIQWFNILLLTALLIWLLYKPVRKYMDGRAARIAQDIESARNNSEKAREDMAHYEQLIAHIEEEREEILNQAHRAAVERSDQILLTAREEARHLLAKAEDEIRIERENVSDEIKRQIIELSALMASRFVEVSIDRRTQEAYLEEVLENWREWS
ncbi:MAG: F0F1 ATP synthase subunit B [Peptococcaceae bacterium]|jgi:F-type H+-transporting ATPase subunit b|nr:F0F1 ATP synthase subunit B [Peptococcaceae bacterium]